MSFFAISSRGAAGRGIKRQKTAASRLLKLRIYRSLHGKIYRFMVVKRLLY